MKRRAGFVYVVILFVLTSIGCIRDNSPLLREDIIVDPFFKLEMKADADIFLYQDSWTGVVAEGSSESLSNLEYEFSNGRLTIRDHGRLRGDTRLYIHVPYLERIEHDCHGQIIGQNYFSMPGEIEIISTRKGDIDLALIADEIKVRHRSKGNIFIEGETGRLDLKVSDSGNFQGFELYSETAKIKISNEGDAEVQVAHELEALINGAGNIYYRGYPKIYIDGNGSGEVIDSN